MDLSLGISIVGVVVMLLIAFGVGMRLKELEGEIEKLDAKKVSESRFRFWHDQVVETELRLFALLEHLDLKIVANNRLEVVKKKSK